MAPPLASTVFLPVLRALPLASTVDLPSALAPVASASAGHPVERVLLLSSVEAGLPVERVPHLSWVVAGFRDGQDYRFVLPLIVSMDLRDVVVITA